MHFVIWLICVRSLMIFLKKAILFVFTDHLNMYFAGDRHVQGDDDFISDYGELHSSAFMAGREKRTAESTSWIQNHTAQSTTSAQKTEPASPPSHRGTYADTMSCC